MRFLCLAFYWGGGIQTNILSLLTLERSKSVAIVRARNHVVAHFE